MAREGEVELTGTDDMYKGDIDYDTSLSFPVTAKQILLESSQKCGVTLKKESFTNGGFVVLKNLHNARTGQFGACLLCWLAVTQGWMKTIF